MTWTRREFNRRLDAHITGINNPNAPFNQSDFRDNPVCEECPEERWEACTEPCQKLLDVIKVNEEAIGEQDLKMREAWLEERMEGHEP